MIKMYGKGHGGKAGDRWVWVFVIPSNELTELMKILDEHFKAHANGATVANLLAQGGVPPENDKNTPNELPA